MRSLISCGAVAARGWGPAHGHSPDQCWGQRQGCWALPHSLNRGLGGPLCVRREGLDPSGYTPQHSVSNTRSRCAECRTHRNARSEQLPAGQRWGKRLLGDELLAADTSSPLLSFLLGSSLSQGRCSQWAGVGDGTEHRARNSEAAPASPAGAPPLHPEPHSSVLGTGTETQGTAVSAPALQDTTIKTASLVPVPRQPSPYKAYSQLPCHRNFLPFTSRRFAMFLDCKETVLK